MTFIKKIIISILTLESRLVLKKYKPRVVAVTGSVGKTSAKDAIYAMLSSTANGGSGRVRKSDKSFNSEIGVPLTILGVGNAWRDPFRWFSNMMRGIELLLFRTDYPKTLVLEVGADHPGDIENLTKWLKPDVAIITKIGDVPVHVEFFPSPEEVLKEKLFLARAVRPGGAIILYGDDPKLAGLSFEGREVMTYGFSDKTDVRAASLAIRYDDGEAREPMGISFDIIYKDQRSSVELDGVLGGSHVYPMLASSAVGVVQGLTLVQSADSLKGYRPPRGRMNLIEGKNGSTIIDDSYNSSPTALASALEALKIVKAGQNSRKVAIIGDMMELGRYSAEEHKKAGRLAAGALDKERGDLLITVGQRAKGIGDGAVSAGWKASSVISFDDSAMAAAKLADMTKAGDIILVKGSQSPRMERVVKALMAEPEKAPELLVRQEKEWLDKK